MMRRSDHCARFAARKPLTTSFIARGGFNASTDSSPAETAPSYARHVLENYGKYKSLAHHRYLEGLNGLGELPFG